MDVDLIAVSKLCCPVCWELIKILRGDYDGLEVRGRHSMLYALELPKHLPQEVLNALIQRFRQHLQTEFQLMISKWRAHSKVGQNLKRQRTPSALSDSAVSITHQSRSVNTGLRFF